MLKNQSTATLPSLPTMESNERKGLDGTKIWDFLLHTAIQQSMGKGLHLAHNWNRWRAIRPGNMVKGIEEVPLLLPHDKHQEEGAHLLRNRFIQSMTTCHIKLIILGCSSPELLPKPTILTTQMRWLRLVCILNFFPPRVILSQPKNRAMAIAWPIACTSWGSKKDFQRPTFHVW